MVIKNSFSTDHGCVRMSAEENCAGIFKQSMGARNRVGIGLSYRPARARICKRLRSPEIDSNESIPPAYVVWRGSTSNRVVVPSHQAGNRFLGSLKGLQIRAQVTKAGGIDFLESIPGLLKSLKIWALDADGWGGVG